MNQRIIKLIRLALREIDSITVEQVTASRIDDYGIVEIPNTFGEKFAELIVQECANWIDENVGMITPEARADLLKHFGLIV